MESARDKIWYLQRMIQHNCLLLVFIGNDHRLEGGSEGSFSSEHQTNYDLRYGDGRNSIVDAEEGYGEISSEEATTEDDEQQSRCDLAMRMISTTTNSSRQRRCSMSLIFNDHIGSLHVDQTYCSSRAARG
jgi:hypothetical protein